MFRVIELAPGQRVELHEGSEHVLRPSGGIVRWVDLSAQDDASLELLRSRFGLHPLAIEDCAHQDQRPKFEEYGDHIFIVTQGFACNGDKVHHLEMHELHAFVGPNFLVTVHLGNIAALDQLWKRVASDSKLLERGADFIYYLLADGMVDDNFPILDLIADELEAIEDEVLRHPRQAVLGRIFELKRHLVAMRKVISPQRDVLGMLSKRGDERISEKTALYLRDVYDHLVRINESIEANRDLLGNALDAYLSSVSQRTNEIMKSLAILSAIFLPLTFVTGFFGQNFEHLPFKSDALMYIMIATMIGLPVGMLMWMKSRDWF
jgi:magnesium transporter